MPTLSPFLLLPVLLLLLLYILLGFNPIRLLRNYLVARHSNFPLLLTPPHPNHIPWQLLGVPLRPILRSLLPSPLFSRLNHTTYGYEWTERRHTHARLGPTFLLVTSGNNELNVADPLLATEILRRPRDFRQTLIGSKVMRIFGDNLITSDGEHWSRQRKLVARNVNEKISGLVWDEARGQTREMVGVYEEESGGTTAEVAEGLKGVAINILGVAGYGVRRGWRESRTAAAADGEKLNEMGEVGVQGREGGAKGGFKLTYIEATRLAIDHIVEASLLPTWIFLLSWMPEAMKRIGYAKQEFAAHTQGMLDRERERVQSGESERVNMLSMLVKESDSQAGGDEKGDEKSAGLTEDEIMGNLFVFTAAGFDTTANTMTYAITMLAASPEWQDWMGEEIDRVLGDRTDDAELEYNEIFPQLVRVLAVMYETLRMFPPVIHVAKGTPTTLSAPGHVSITHPTTGVTYHLAANTLIYINCVAIQHDPSIYGPDVDDFRPDRFIEEAKGEKGDASTRIKNFGKGTFMAWSGGPRVCPGMKMSQVEFASVFVTIFRRWRVELVRKDVGGRRETMEETVMRTKVAMMDSQSRLTLQMNKPKEVKIRFVRRSR